MSIRTIVRIPRVTDPRATELRRLVILVLTFVVLPSVLLLSVGVLVLVFGSATQDYVFGAMILGLVLTMSGGIVATLVYIKREANLAKLQTEFVSKVSHDLKTPLTSIRMFVETLQLGRVQQGARVQQCLDVLAAETARLSTMIDRLLGWARMEAGKRVYHLEPTTVESIVDAALGAFESHQLNEPTRIEREIPEGLPAVRADRDAIVEALLNLLQNAYRYAGEDKRIRVRAAERRGSVALEVEDNGPGIARREQHRIFEKFYRVADPWKRNIQGTGLGLAIVEHIVRAHNGTVSVDSDLGQGSTFSILLPAEGRIT